MDINDKINAEDVVEDATLPESEESVTPKTSLEFEISEDSGLVFMSETDVSFDEKGGLVFSAEADITAEEEVVAPEVDTMPEEEFDVPETYTVDEKYTSTSFVEDPFGINTMYVPRFTGVSDNYRMKDDPRPAPAPAKPEVVSDEKAEPSVFDPIAEIDDKVEVERVVVSSAPVKSDEPTDESIRVYKFVEPDDVDESIPTPVVEAPVVEEIPEIETPETVVEETVVEEKPIKRPEDYSIPDPESESTVIEYADVEEDLGSATEIKNNKREFVSPIQRDSFKDKFLDGLMSVRFRLAAAALLLLMMVGFEVMRLAGKDPLDYISLGATYASAVIDLMFSVCLFVIALPEVISAVLLLFKKQIAPELTLIVSLGALVGYTAVVISEGGVNYLRFGILYGIQVVCAIVAAIYRLKGDFAAFKIVSKNQHKHVLIKKLTRELPRENMALDGAVDEYSSKTARMFKTAFVNDFCLNSQKRVENSSNNLLMLGASVGLSLVTGIITFFLYGNSFTYAMQSLVLVLLVATPAFSILVHKLPYFCAARLAGEDNIAFVGETALYDGADVDVIAYEDVEVFGEDDVAIKKVHLYGKVINTAKAMKQMYAIFAGVGGPLDAVFSASVDKKGAVAEDIVIEPDGISGIVEGRRVHAGTEEYMIRKGVVIPSDDYRTARTATDSTRVMYGAEDGTVYVKFFIRYSFTEEFTMILPYLKEQGIVPLIYTRDPNISNELLENLTMGADVIRVMKKDGGRTTEEKTYRHLASNIVTLGDRGNVVNVAFLCRRYTAFQSAQSVAELISMIVGAVLAGLIGIGGMIDAAAIGLAFALSVWQAAWCVVLSIRSRLAFKINKNKG